MTHKKNTAKAEPTERIQVVISAEAAQRLRIAAALRNVWPAALLSKLIINSLPPASQALSEADHSSNA